MIAEVKWLRAAGWVTREHSNRWYLTRRGSTLETTFDEACKVQKRRDAANKGRVKAHTCHCSNAPCPCCGGHGPSGEWTEGAEVVCDDCGAKLYVTVVETCKGRSLFEKLCQHPMHDDACPHGCEQPDEDDHPEPSPVPRGGETSDEDSECRTCGPECHCGEDDPQAGQCPGCGGSCQTACQ